MIPTFHTLQWRKESEAATQRMINRIRADRRRHLYQTDPIYRLTKLKDKRERRLRARLSGQTGTKW